MIDYDILNEWNYKIVRFVAKLDCEENTPTSLKKRLAILWAIENHADLTGCNLSRTDFRGYEFKNINFGGSSFYGSDFRDCSLWGINMQDCNFTGCTFKDKNGLQADFQNVDVTRATLPESFFTDAKIGHVVRNNKLLKKGEGDHLEGENR